jgi:hypothetical protein
MVFLMYVGGVQFLYACLTGGYPFNSFLAGFAAAVGQFVLAGMNPWVVDLLHLSALFSCCGCPGGFVLP